MEIDIIRKLARDSKGMSITDLETALNFGNSTISKWPKGNPTISKVKAVADFLGVKIDDLIEENPTTESSEVSISNIINDVTPEEILLINYWRSLSPEEHLLVLKKLGLL